MSEGSETEGTEMGEASSIMRRRRARDVQVEAVVESVLQQQRAAMAVMQTVRKTHIEEEAGGGWGGRPVGAKNYKRGTYNWVKDYVGTNGEPPNYPSSKFRRRFAIPRTLFQRLKGDLLQFRPEYWSTRMIGGNRPGKPTDVKILSCLRLLAAGISSDQLDDANYMAEETTGRYFKSFCRDISAMYGEVYLDRWPTEDELAGIEQRYAELGFPGCAGAIDCMKLYWKNCPYRKKGQYLNRKESSKLAVVQCEAWCDHDLYCWHWYCGRPGTNNDINVLSRSPLFHAILAGRFKFQLPQEYRIVDGGANRRIMYLLADGIYPHWPIFAKPNKQSTDADVKRYSGKQESVRKDIERMFGVVQSRFGILRHEVKGWRLEDLITIADCCIILHNLIVRMQQSGAFAEEADGIDLVEEFYAEDVESARTARQEEVDNGDAAAHAVLPDWMAETERVLMNEVVYTDAVLADRLERELVMHTKHLRDARMA